LIYLQQEDYRIQTAGKETITVPTWCPAAGDEPDIAQTIRSFVMADHNDYGIADRFTNCDTNARVCWAMLVGGLTMHFILIGTCSDVYHPLRRCMTLDRVLSWISSLCASPSTPEPLLLLVRFVDADNTSDGHSLVIRRTVHGELELFQAYYNHTAMVAYRGQRAIHALEFMVHTMRAPVPRANAATFCLEKETSNAFTSVKGHLWLVHRDLCYVYYKPGSQ
jgi:hypothetical protein